MKLLLIFLLLLTFNVSGQIDSAKVKWDETTYDFGRIPLNVPATHQFNFINNYDDSLQIINVEASCGCTQPDWTKEPIGPRKTGFVRATYSAKTPGQFKKQVTIYLSKSPYPINLILQGEVIDGDHQGHTH